MPHLSLLSLSSISCSCRFLIFLLCRLVAADNRSIVSHRTLLRLLPQSPPLSPDLFIFTSSAEGTIMMTGYRVGANLEQSTPARHAVWERKRCRDGVKKKNMPKKEDGKRGTKERRRGFWSSMNALSQRWYNNIILVSGLLKRSGFP